MSEEIKTFEDFNKAIDESHDEGCGCCFSFHHYRHLDPDTRKLAYLGFMANPTYHQALATELEKREPLPIDDNIYWMVMCVDPQAKLEEADLIRLQIQLIRRATEMIEKKMPAAWVAVRSYMWTERADPLWAYLWLEDTDDLEVWQVIFQCTPWDLPKREKFKSLGLAAIRSRAYEYAMRAIAMGDAVKPYVVAVNGVKALAALQDPRVVEVMEKLPRHNLDRVIKEDLTTQIKYLTNDGQPDFIPTLEKVLSLCQSKL